VGEHEPVPVLLSVKSFVAITFTLRCRSALFIDEICKYILVIECMHWCFLNV